MIIEPFSPFRTSEYQVKFATSEAWERDEAHALRRQVFCREQQIFERDDRDAIDDHATPIVALSMLGVAADRLVGTVRIHEAEPGLWWGSRLAVHEDFRKIGALGATLIRLAVSSAHAMGCHTFLANVQVQNGLLFRRLHWDVDRGVRDLRQTASAHEGGSRLVSTLHHARGGFRGARQTGGLMAWRMSTSARSPKCCAQAAALLPNTISAA